MRQAQTQTNKYAYDDNSVVVIIGSGAGGGTLAHELCSRGIKVVVLEAGNRIEKEDFVHDELKAFGQLTWADRRIATGDWLAAKTASPTPSWTVKAVGGSTIHWNGLAYRFQDHEFKARSVYGEIEGASLIDWPLTLAELEPYYVKAEEKMGVTGTHGIEKHPYNNNYTVLYNGARRVGYKNISNSNLAINSDFRDGRNPCIQLGFCNQGCKIGAKWSTLYSEIPKAEISGYIDLRTGVMAQQIHHDKKGKAKGVLYVDAKGIQHFQAARIVAVAGNAIETPRILLNSSTSMHPGGLANSSGQVGKNYTRHVCDISMATFDKPVNMHRGITMSGTVFDEAKYNENRRFAGGYLMENMSLGLSTLALMMEPGAWGTDYASFLEKYAYMAGIFLVGEEMPQSKNGVTLDPSEKDQHGLAVPRIHVDEHPMSLEMKAHYRGRSEAIFEAVGSTSIKHSAPPNAAHNMGTCRMSKLARDGVTNSYGQCHEVDNLFISDGSLFPTSGAENPTLTIVALVLRQAEYIASLMSRGEL